MKLKITFLFFSIAVYSQIEKPKYDFEIIRTEINYVHNVDTTLTKLYNKKNELLNGKYRIIHEDSVQTFVDFKNGLWDGLYKTYYKTGELCAIIPFENGIKIGNATWYYKNGNKNKEISYLNRKQNGVCKWYHENGYLLKEFEYINDKLNGVCKWYFENEKLQLLAIYKNGLKNGIYKKYNQNGKLEDVLYFINDKEVSKIDFDRFNYNN